MHVYNTGFSLIELTVVLVLVSLIGSLVLPGLSNAYFSVSNRGELEQMQLRLGVLGYEAFASGKSIRIETQEDVQQWLAPEEGWRVVVIDPIEVTHTGVCVSGELTFVREEFKEHVRVTPPYCWEGS